MSKHDDELLSFSSWNWRMELFMKTSRHEWQRTRAHKTTNTHWECMVHLKSTAYAHVTVCLAFWRTFIISLCLLSQKKRLSAKILSEIMLDEQSSTFVSLTVFSFRKKHFNFLLHFHFYSQPVQSEFSILLLCVWFFRGVS